jgi:hypothetical protein
MARRLADELRGTFTDTQWRVFQARLTGARKAIEDLRDRAPALARLYFGAQPREGSTRRALSEETQAWIDCLVERLLDVEEHGTEPTSLDRRLILKLVSRMGQQAAER